MWKSRQNIPANLPWGGVQDLHVGHLPSRSSILFFGYLGRMCCNLLLGNMITVVEHGSRSRFAQVKMKDFVVIILVVVVVVAVERRRMGRHEYPERASLPQQTCLWQLPISWPKEIEKPCCA